MMTTQETAPAPKMTRRALAKAATRQKVLDAAAQLFRTEGYKATTMRDIAQCANMSTGAVFASFLGKAELFLAVMQAERSTLYASLEEAAETEGTVWEVIRAISSTDYAAAHHYFQLMGMLAENSRHRIPSAASHLEHEREETVSLLLSCLQAGARRREICETQCTSLTADTIWDVHLANYRLAIFHRAGPDDLNDRFRKQLSILLPAG